MDIQWDESFSVDVPHLDEDHKKLIDLLNYLQNCKEMGVNSESISQAVQQIREFASLHFRREEKYMLSINYPDYDAHKKTHKQLRQEMGTLFVDVMNHKPEAPENMYHFLYNWVFEHLQKEDKKLQLFKESIEACKK